MKNSYKDVEALFNAKPSANQKAWGIIHDFYHYVLTHMEKNNITKTELAKRINKSKASVSQMFNKNPNVSVGKLVEIADAVGIEISIRPINHEERAIEDIRLVIEDSTNSTGLVQITTKSSSVNLGKPIQIKSCESV